MNEIKGYLYSEKILKDKDEGPQTWRNNLEHHFLDNSKFQLFFPDLNASFQNISFFLHLISKNLHSSLSFYYAKYARFLIKYYITKTCGFHLSPNIESCLMHVVSVAGITSQFMNNAILYLALEYLSYVMYFILHLNTYLRK